MIIKEYWIDGDTYDGGDIDLIFKKEKDAIEAYNRIKAPYKKLRAITRNNEEILLKKDFDPEYMKQFE